MEETWKKVRPQAMEIRTVFKSNIYNCWAVGRRTYVNVEMRTGQTKCMLMIFDQLDC